MRHLVLGERNRDIGRILENIVYLELIRRVDYQVAESVLDPSAFERKFEPLRSIKDHYPKFVLTMDDLPSGQDGIQQMNIVDLLLSE